MVDSRRDLLAGKMRPRNVAHILFQKVALMAVAATVHCFLFQLSYALAADSILIGKLLERGRLLSVEAIAPAYDIKQTHTVMPSRKLYGQRGKEVVKKGTEACGAHCLNIFG